MAIAMVVVYIPAKMDKSGQIWWELTCESYPFENTANPTWGDIFECCFKAQRSKLERLSSLKRGKRDVRALSFELSKMTPQVGLAVI